MPIPLVPENCRVTLIVKTAIILLLKKKNTIEIHYSKEGNFDIHAYINSLAKLRPQN